MKRKIVLIVSIMLMFVMLSVVFAGCAPKEPVEKEQPITITIWHAWSGTELEVLDSAISKSGESHPKVIIEQLQVPFDQLKNKFQTNAAGGEGRPVPRVQRST